MEKYLKKLRPAMLKFMRKHYCEDEVQRRWITIVKLDKKWLREEGDLGGSANPMSSNMMLCYAMCAFYEAVDRNFTRDDFYILFNDAMTKPFALLNLIDMNRFEDKKWLIRIVYFLLEKYKKKSDKNRGKGWGNTWRLRVNPDKHKKGIAYVLDTCPLYEFAQKHGYMDILPYMCESDHLVAKAFHAKLIRHNTLSGGDGKCEYWYVGDRSPEAANDEKSK